MWGGYNPDQMIETAMTETEEKTEGIDMAGYVVKIAKSGGETKDIKDNGARALITAEAAKWNNAIEAITRTEILTEGDALSPSVENQYVQIYGAFTKG